MTVEEKFRGVSGDYNSRNVEFIVDGAATESDAMVETAIYIATNYPGSAIDGLPLSNIAVEEYSYPLGLFRTTATFSRVEEQPETNDTEISFDVNLDTRRIYRSLATTSYTAQGKTTKPSHNRINVNADGIAEGADVRIPVAGFQVTWYAPFASVTPTYRRTILNMVGKTNNAVFYGHNIGEVLFAGVAGRARSTDDWELTYRFEVSANQTNVVVGEGGDAITIDSVKGWELIWVDYFEDKDGNQRVDKPREAYVETIYESADFSQLGIGT